MNRTSSSTLKAYSLPFVFCVLSVVAASFLYDCTLDFYDDGVAAQSAHMVIHGGVPYRDFWTLYAPGSYYVDALLLKVFGESLLSIRMMLPLLTIIQAGFLYGTLRRIVTNRYAAVAAGVAFLAYIPIRIQVTHCLTYSAAAAAAVGYFLVRWIEDPKPRWEYALGLALGCMTLFRQDSGFYTVLALAPVLFAASTRLGANRSRTFLRVFGSCAVIIGFLIVYLASRGALLKMYKDTIEFAVFVFPHSRKVPYPVPALDLRLLTGVYRTPPLIGFLFRLVTFYILPAGLAIFGVLSVVRLRGPETTRRELAAAAVTLLALTLFLMISARPVPIRIAASVILAVAAFAAYASAENKVMRRSGMAMSLLLVVGFVPFAISTVILQHYYSSDVITLRGGVYTIRGLAEAVDVTSEYVRNHTTPDEKILSGAPIMYFTTNRDPATPYSEPQAALIDDPGVQQEIIRDVERSHTRYFIRCMRERRDSYFMIEREREPQILVDYINRNYKQVLFLYMLSVYERKTPFDSRP